MLLTSAPSGGKLSRSRKTRSRVNNRSKLSNPTQLTMSSFEFVSPKLYMTVQTSGYATSAPSRNTAGAMKSSACQPWCLKIEGSLRPRGLPTGPGTGWLLIWSCSCPYAPKPAWSASDW